MHPARLISKALRKKGFSLISLPCQMQGVLNVNGYNVSVEISVRDFDFVELPRISVINYGGLPSDIVAHIDFNGVCYAAKGSLILDRYKPVESVLRVLKLAEDTLKESSRKGVPEAAIAEFQHYWSGHRLYALDPVNASSVPFNQVPNLSNLDCLVLPSRIGASRLGKLKTPHIISSESPLVPPIKGAIQNGQDFTDWLENNGIGVDAHFWKAIADKKIIVIQGANGQVAAQADFNDGRNLKGFRSQSVPIYLASKRADISIIRYSIEKLDKEFVTRRSLGKMQNLSNKKIAVIGCGTIGGFAARLLVQNGAGFGEKLHLFDNEVLETGNLSRHILDAGDLGQNKSTALARKLSFFHPDVQIEGVHRNAKDYLNNFINFDLVIDATGEQNFSMALNSALLEHRKRGAEVACIYAWVWNNGIAVQSLLSNGIGGCYACLTPNGINAPWAHDPRKDPMADPEFIAASCSDGAFVPFGVAASTMAAALISKQALEWRNGEHQSILDTIRLDFDHTKEVPRKRLKPTKNCRACSNA